MHKPNITPPKELRRWVAGGGQPTASHMNEIVDWARALQQSIGLSGVVADDARPSHTFVGRVVTADPNGEPEPEGPYYWVQAQAIVGGTGGSTPTTMTFAEDTSLKGDPSAPEPTIYRVCNLAEYEADTHRLKEDDRVLVLAVEDAGDPQQVRHVMHAAPPSGTFVVLLAVNTGSNGTQTTAATFKYDVTKRDGTPLGTDLAVERPRARLGRVTAATKGIGEYDHNGDFVLVEAWEVFGATGCEVA